MTIRFVDLRSYREDFQKFAERRGLSFETSDSMDPAKLVYEMSGHTDQTEAALSDLGFDHEDISDGTVGYFDPLES